MMEILLFWALIWAFIIAWIVVWVKTLMRMAKKNQWTWFILGLLFNFTIIIYWIVNWKVVKKMLK